jgi:hypothetical protein
VTDERSQRTPSREQLHRELAMIADVRTFLRESEGPDFPLPTTIPDQLLDQWNALGEETD